LRVMRCNYGLTPNVMPPNISLNPTHPRALAPREPCGARVSLGARPTMIWLHLIDTIVMTISLIGPIYLVVRYNWIGILLGAVIFWALPFVWGELLWVLDPESGGPQ
jgi:hypothetical protein